MKNIEPIEIFDVSPVSFHHSRQSWLAESLSEIYLSVNSSNHPATFSNVEKSLSNPITPGSSSLLRFHRGSAIAPSRNGCISRYFIVVSPESRWNFYNFSLHLLFQSLLAPELGPHVAVFKETGGKYRRCKSSRREMLKLRIYLYPSINSYFHDTRFTINVTCTIS